jgi:hypothetical protein
MTRRTRDQLLFSSGDLNEHLELQRRTMLDGVSRLPEEQLLGAPLEDLVLATSESCCCKPLALHVDRTTVTDHETTISIDNVRDGRFLYDADDDDGPRRIPGHRYNFHVPFDGDPRFWKLQGSQISFSPPYATVGHQELVFAYDVPQHEGTENLRQRFDQEVKQASELASNSSNIVERFNASLPNIARSAIERRKNELLKARKTVAALGFPLRTREGASAQPVPLMRKPIIVRAPATSSTPFKAEPAIDDAQYDSILHILANMSLMFERSPSTFKNLNEEAIRTHFLVQLNGQFEGAATGETFNYEGKTDILIRFEGKNVFIAECKFWTGGKGFTDALNQLLSYTSWRDTKTALLLFNRGTQMSTVLGQIKGLIEAHPQFKRHVPQNGETRFRAVLRQANDTNRELALTVLVFDVPG